MTTPRRYVRVEVDGFDGTWDAACAVCDWRKFFRDHAAAIWTADRHARTCPAVRAATERDALHEYADAQAEAIRLLQGDLANARDMADRYKAALQSYEAAYAVDRDQLRVELDRMRADRDRLRDRLHQINPLSKDNR